MGVDGAIRSVYLRLRGRPIPSDVPTSVTLSFAQRHARSAVRGTLRESIATGKFAPQFRGQRVRIRNRRKLSIGRSVSIGDDVIIDAFSRDGISIGDNVTIGRSASILGSGVIANPGTGITIGDGTSIGPFNSILGQGGVTIGKNVMFAPNVVVVSENHITSDLDIPIRLQGESRAPVVIGDGCWLGANVVVTAGAKLGDGCVIGAGSVVIGDIPPNTIAVGAPARVIRQRGT